MSTFSDSFIAANMRKFPPETLPSIRQRLEGLDDRQINDIVGMPLKDPTIALLFSIFLGAYGVDRFYLGQAGLGVGKLLVTIFTLGLGGFIWHIVDGFLIMGATREENLKTLNHVFHALTNQAGVVFDSAWY